MKSIVRNARGGIIALICISIAGYACYEAKNLVLGPIVKIDEPINGMSTESPMVEIHGSARNIVSISLNGRQITTDESGVFSEEIPLSPGYNIAELALRDRFGREKDTLIEMTRKELPGQLTRK